MAAGDELLVVAVWGGEGISEIDKFRILACRDSGFSGDATIATHVWVIGIPDL
jgi:hypothetical protein